ncbi:MAG: alpha/beta hydrolase [Candidatus Hodarchaeota archaeon]
MSRINLPKKTIALTCIFFAIFIIGTVFIFITPFNVKSTYGLTAITDDGVRISFNVFEPRNGGNNKKAVIIGHGVMGNKELMKGYAIELAAAGFVAIPFDFRGHGLSTGDLSSGDIVDDIIAIKDYLNSRGDIDINNLGYIGLSMGGAGQQLINIDTDFKCFIGTATWLDNNLRRGNSTNPLNVLIIQGIFDELLDVSSLKESIANRTELLSENVNVNKLYGSFENGNATKLYLDDNANHLFSYWDTDFIREAKNWVINTFPDVIQFNENFYAHIRLIILIIQIFGGIGLFIVLIEPFTALFLKKKEERREIKEFQITEISTRNLTFKMIIYSLVLAIPGILIMVLINLFLGLALFGFLISLLFGQSFGQLILVWRLGKHNNNSFFDILKKPFKDTRINLLSHLGLGISLAAILFLILYLSIGLNYFGLVPSITKSLWVPIYMLITFFTFIIYGLAYQFTFQPRFGKSNKDLSKVILLTFSFMFIYMFVYVLILSLVIRSFFYFGFLIPISIATFLLISLTWSFLYRKTGNIIAGAIITAVLLTMLISTAASLQNMINFIFGLTY